MTSVYLKSESLTETCDLAITADHLASFAKKDNACAPSDLIAREHYAAAIALLEQAAAQFRLADLHEARALGELRMGR